MMLLPATRVRPLSHRRLLDQELPSQAGDEPTMHAQVFIAVVTIAQSRKESHQSDDRRFPWEPLPLKRIVGSLPDAIAQGVRRTAASACPPRWGRFLLDHLVAIVAQASMTAKSAGSG